MKRYFITESVIYISLISKYDRWNTSKRSRQFYLSLQFEYDKDKVSFSPF